MSKSLGNILDPIEIINRYGVDQLRYYLIKEVSLGNDGNVSLENLKNCINYDLANNYGNLCQRVFSFIEKNCSNKVPKPKELNKDDIKLTNTLKNAVKQKTPGLYKAGLFSSQINNQLNKIENGFLLIFT